MDIINTKTIKSSVVKDEKTWLFCLKLPWILRYFEDIIYFYDNIIKSYWKKYFVWKNIFLKDTLLWFSSFYWYKIVCIIDLKSLESKYFFVQIFDFINFVLEEIEYYAFIYKDFNWIIWYYSDLNNQNYIINIEKNSFVVKNSIFQTEVYNYNIKDIVNYKLEKTKIYAKNEIKDYLSIADFYIFDDFFIKSSWYEKFYEFLKLFEDKHIKINDTLYYKFSL